MSNRRAIRILIIALTVFLVFAYRNIRHSRIEHNRHICMQNQQAIEGVKEQFAIEHDGQAPERFGELIPAYLKSQPVCPSGGAYTLGDMQIRATCDYAGHVWSGE